MGTGRQLVARTAVTFPALGPKAPSGISRLLSLRTDSPHLTFLGGASGKEPARPCRRCRSSRVPSLGWDHPLEEGMANPLQYSCLESPMDREEPGRLQSMGSQSVGPE